MKKTLTLLFYVLIVVVFTACKKDSSANFSCTKDGLSVQFTNLSNNSESYTWNFGDGKTSYETNPKHVYAKAGTYTVQLTAENRSSKDFYSMAVNVESNDERDIFLGKYYGEVNGSLSVDIGSQKQTIPADGTVTVVITKLSSKNRIQMEAMGLTFKGTVSGTHVTFDPLLASQVVENGIKMNVTHYVTGTSSGNNFLFTDEVTGSAYINGASFPITGKLTAVSSK